MARDHQTLATQERIFRIATRNGLTLKAISLDADIPYNTLRSYAGHNGEPVEMPVSALRKLVGVVPDDLLSLLLPDGRTIVRLPDGVDLDDFEDACRDFLDTKCKAHHKNSPAGCELSDGERADLNRKVIPLRSAAA